MSNRIRDPCSDLSESLRCCTPLVVVESIRGGGLLASVDIDSLGRVGGLGQFLLIDSFVMTPSLTRVRVHLTLKKF